MALEPRKKLGLLIQDTREAKGLSFLDVSEETGLAKEIILKMEAGIINPTKEQFWRVIKSETLDCSPAEIQRAGKLLRVIFPLTRMKYDNRRVIFARTRQTKQICRNR